MACICSERAERYNFAAGPAMLPTEVRLQLADWLTQAPACGVPLLEQPFTGAGFRQLMEETEGLLRTLLAIPPDYEVLFAQGGASAQFGLLPLNLLAAGQSAAYLVTGHWSRKAFIEACRHATARLAASGEATGYTAMPPSRDWQVPADAGYCHVTSNETGSGLQMQAFPELAVPLVADMTSDLLTRPIPVERFGMIYASTQKNLGVPGLCLLIVRRDLLHAPRAGLPSAFSYQVLAEQHSRFNTPPTLALYCTNRMLHWIAGRGGVTAMAQRCRERSRQLYDCIDASGLYRCAIRHEDRSTVNVCFELTDDSLLAPFLQQAERSGLHNLQGHSALGGVRASLYNAMPVEGVARLVSFMRAFEKRNA